MIMKLWKAQKQVVIKQRAKIYTEALYLALNIERELYQQRNGLKSGVGKKSISLKLINRGPCKVWGVGKKSKN